MSAVAQACSSLYRIRYRGQIQGVGFRPHIWRVASNLKLSGQVCNTAAGVEVLLQATPEQLQSFLFKVREGLPPMALIRSTDVEPVSAASIHLPNSGFSILASRDAGGSTAVLPDRAVCESCSAELFDPSSRRYAYPFISCTHCGPRYSMTRALPYDRATTTMVDFIPCVACEREYGDPADRRFHAQTLACAACGPEVWLENASGRVAVQGDLFAFLAQRLGAGAILALKGWGGFHLCCDARQPEVIQRLRGLKGRPAKALAVMMPGLEEAKKHVRLSAREQHWLSAPEAPILLCQRRDGATESLSAELAPDSDELGIMLPCTPIHHLLLAAFKGPLVMTSGNRSGQLQVIDNDCARQTLTALADDLLLHDLPIANRVDDAVMRVRPEEELPVLIRPGRGFVPLHLSLPAGFETEQVVLALGGDLKNTLCLSRENELILSPCLGDLSHVESLAAHQALQIRQQQLYRQAAQVQVCDRHPGYHSVQQATARFGKSLQQVQHHHAHLAGCLLDNGYPLDGPEVLGLCFDGSGYGDDGTLWGGDCLLGGYGHARRVARLRPFALPGGNLAVRQPWRVLISQLQRSGVEQASWYRCWPWLSRLPLDSLLQMLGQGFNAPLTSSMGRLFDAVAAALGCYPEGISYEGQAALSLQRLAQRGSNVVDGGYVFGVNQQSDGLWQLDPAGIWLDLIADLQAGVPREVIALKFHQGLVQGVTELIEHLGERYVFRQVALTGGVMQNELLRQQLCDRITALGYGTFCHRLIPCNDAGLSAGQAVVALARLQREA